ncbi:HAD family hydrolase [Microbulbifer guangxiensis]|uniref:HAD family hydrolase n=1 Tax=Microbulbifer guangxiensis TaxID=2904249 RepID=UPI001F433EE9|nr:haloacid dehalogenase-like hydrolase [Microbulbifer guangxiensis]
MKWRMALALAICMPVFYQSASAEEAHADHVISHILEARLAIIDNAEKSESDQFVFLAFWDFDDTILKGDCAGGLRIDDKTIYRGLTELAIESGYSQIYDREEGLPRFWKDYVVLEENIGPWISYPFLPQMLRGSREKDVSSLARNHFEDVLQNYFFKSSIKILNALEKNGIQNHVISASPDIFVDAAASTLGLPKERFNGVEVKIEDGRLTEEIVYPVTWANGKVEKLTSIVAATKRQHPGKQVVVLAAFGNSYGSDGPFMKHVATQALPAGKPVGVMINGGAPLEPYQDLFLKVEQSEVQSSGQ